MFLRSPWNMHEFLFLTKHDKEPHEGTRFGKANPFRVLSVSRQLNELIWNYNQLLETVSASFLTLLDSTATTTPAITLHLILMPANSDKVAFPPLLRMAENNFYLTLMQMNKVYSFSRSAAQVCFLEAFSLFASFRPLLPLFYFVPAIDFLKAFALILLLLLFKISFEMW